MRRPLLGLFACVLVYVGLRALVLYTAFDSVGMTMYELYPMGTLPRVLLAGGVEVPLSSYYDNAAGQLVTALLAVPAYLALGPTYLALKLVPFLLGLGALVVVWALLREHFGPRAALLGGLLFAAAPATLVKYSLKASGNHYENVFFTLLALWALYHVHTGGRRAARLWLAGWSMGLAIFVFLGAIIPVGLVFGVHLGLVGWRRFGRDLLHGLPAFALGLLPLVLINLGTRGRGAAFLAAKFAGGSSELDLGRVAGRFADFFVVHLPRSMTYPDLFGIPGRVGGWTFLALYAVALIAALPDVARACLALLRGAFGAGARHEREDLGAFVLVPLVLYLPLTALAYALTDLRMGGYEPPLEDGGYRYYIPTLVFGCLLIAATADRWLARARLRGAGVAFTSLMCVTCLFDLPLVDWTFARTGLGARYEGHYMKQAARALLGRKQGLDDDEVVRQAESFPPVFRVRVYEGLGFYRLLAADPGARGGLEQVDLDVVAAAWPPARRPDAWRGAGTHLRYALLDAGRREEALALLSRWNERDPVATAHVREGLAFDWDVVLVREMQRHLDLGLEVVELLPDEARGDAVRGLGIDAGRALRREIAVERPWIEALWARLPEGTSLEFLRGLGVGLADGAEEAGLPAASVPIFENDPTPMLAALRARLIEIHGEDAPTHLARVAADLPTLWRDAWGSLGEGRER